jgi:hypothetical protein
MLPQVEDRTQGYTTCVLILFNHSFIHEIYIFSEHELVVLLD